MGKSEPFEVDPKQYDVSRRRFLQVGAAAASIPLLGGMMEVLTERGAAAQSFRDESMEMFASHPAYKFTFVNHVTTNTFFTATQYGLQDAASILGIPKPQWTGSSTSATSDMVNAIDIAISGKVNGIATTLIDPTAFNAPVHPRCTSAFPSSPTTPTSLGTTVWPTSGRATPRPVLRPQRRS